MCLLGQFHAWELPDSASARERSDHRWTEFIKMLIPWEDLETLSSNFSIRVTSEPLRGLLDKYRRRSLTFTSDDLKKTEHSTKIKLSLDFTESCVSKLLFHFHSFNHVRQFYVIYLRNLNVSVSWYFMKRLPSLIGMCWYFDLWINETFVSFNGANGI